MYLFISKNEVEAYNGEILKRYIGKRLVKTIANPTDEDLMEFGYMELIEGEMPEYDIERQSLVTEYAVINHEIHCNYSVMDMQLTEA